MRVWRFITLVMDLVLVRLNETTDQEEDMLDKAWGLEMDSRLSCQCVVGDEDLVVEIPKYNLNHANEAAH